MKNIDIAHNFFYNQTPQANANTHFINDRFYSYYTCIAEILTDKTGQPVLIISNNNFSNTTQRHINNLIKANPCYRVIRLPQRMGAKSFYEHFETTKALLLDILKNYTPKDTKKKADREDFIHTYKMLENLYTIIDGDIPQEITNKYKIIKEIHTQKEKKQKESQQKRIEKQKENLEKILNTNNTCLLAKEYTTQKLYKIKTELYKKLQLDKYAYLFSDSTTNTIKTTKCVTIPLDIIKPFLKLWQHKKLKHGMKIDVYTVLSVTDDYVQVGCHKILTKNIQDLINEINKTETVAA